jgi:hypothetical protein
MMKSAENRPRGKLAMSLDRPMARRILAQGQMRADFVVVARIGHKDPAQMHLAKDDDMVEALPADRANQPPLMPVLPGRPCNRGRYSRLGVCVAGVVLLAGSALAQAPLDAYVGQWDLIAEWAGGNQRPLKSRRTGNVETAWATRLSRRTSPVQ